MCITILEFLQSILEDTVKLQEKKIERSWKHTPKKNRQFDKALIIYL